VGPEVIVVDTNVLAYLVIRGPDSQRAERVRVLDADWPVPSLFYHEWLNVAARYLKRSRFERDEAIRVYGRGVALVKVDDLPPDPTRILNLNLQSGCTSYDCQFVALAERLRTRVVTEDQEVLLAFPDIAVSLHTF
jgi:predicted nucleic acid-binding protein